MSTPPFIDLPAGASVERWPVRGTERSVMHLAMDEAPTWAVLVPGFTGSKEDFIAVLPQLATRGVGAVSYDQLGQYESDGSDDPADYRLPLLAQDLGGVITRAQERFGRDDAPHLVGHSFGGLVSQQAVIDGVAVASFTALCTGPGALPGERQQGLAALIEALDHTSLADIWNMMRAIEAASDAPQPDPPVADFLHRRWLANSPVGLQEFGRLLLSQSSLSAAMTSAVSAGLRASVVWGEHDDAWPIDMQVAMGREWPARTEQLDGLGHSPNVDDPAALVEALLRGW